MGFGAFSCGDALSVSFQPHMSMNRRALVLQVFRKVDKDKSGVITIDDLKERLNPKKHLKYVSGEWDEDQVLQNFLQSFSGPGKKFLRQVCTALHLLDLYSIVHIELATVRSIKLNAKLPSHALLFDQYVTLGWESQTWTWVESTHGLGQKIIHGVRTCNVLRWIRMDWV